MSVLNSGTFYDEEETKELSDEVIRIQAIDSAIEEQNDELESGEE